MESDGHMRGLWLAVAALVLSAAPLAPRLLGDDPTYCIAGTVINGVTGEPIRRAAVALVVHSSIVLTDAGGAFRFCKLTPRDYIPNAEKPGFQSAGEQVKVGPSREDVVIRLQPLAIVKGIVTDSEGEPVPNVLVQSLSVAIQGGRRQVTVHSEAATNDRGEYRLPDLPTGRYYFRAVGWQNVPLAFANPAAADYTDEAFAPAYFGGGADLSSATAVAIEAGHDLSADLQVTLRPAYKITGMLTGLVQHLPIQLELLHGEDDLSAPGANRIVINPSTGAFQIHDAVSGSYILRAIQGEDEQRQYGEQNVQVNGADAVGLNVPLAGGVPVTGMLRTPETKDSSAQCSLSLVPMGLAPAQDVDLDDIPPGEFEIASVLPGHYRVGIHCGGGYVSSARAGETDLLSHNELVVSPGVSPPPLEINLDPAGGTVDVAVTADGAAAPATVVLVPDTSSDLTMLLLDAPAGRCSFQDLAPGDYEVYAFRANEEFEYTSPEARQSWTSRATKVTVAERAQQSLAIKLPSGGSQ